MNLRAGHVKYNNPESSNECMNDAFLACEPNTSLCVSAGTGACLGVGVLGVIFDKIRMKRRNKNVPFDRSKATVAVQHRGTITMGLRN